MIWETQVVLLLKRMTGFISEGVLGENWYVNWWTEWRRYTFSGWALSNLLEAQMNKKIEEG
jgi:hypothetical protein